MSKALKALIKNVQRRLEVGGHNKAWLAKESGITESTIGRMLKGENEPGIDSVEKISVALECSVADLLIDADEIKPQPKSIVELAGAMQTLSEENEKLKKQLENAKKHPLVVAFEEASDAVRWRVLRSFGIAPNARAPTSQIPSESLDAILAKLRRIQKKDLA